MSYKYCINGRFMTRQITGVDRYAREMVRELDKLLVPGEACVALPAADLIDPLELSHIDYVKVGTRNGHLWEQIDLAGYLHKTKLLGVNLCNTAPLFNPGIVCIHDMNVRANPGFYSKRFAMAYKLMFKYLCKNAKSILTVSKFSEFEIIKYYPLAQGKVEVISCAWQHIDRVNADFSILEKLGLKPKHFYFAMSSLAPNKNLKWLVETARLNPGETFVIAGGINSKVFGEHDIPEADNVIYAGYVSDEESKALMSECKAFLYPTFYEGFGIPPMEAMACGAQAIVSDTDVMHEVYGDNVAYINPFIPEENLSEIVRDFVYPTLSRYSWAGSSHALLDALRRCSNA